MEDLKLPSHDSSSIPLIARLDHLEFVVSLFFINFFLLQLSYENQFCHMYQINFSYVYFWA